MNGWMDGRMQATKKQPSGPRAHTCIQGQDPLQKSEGPAAASVTTTRSKRTAAQRAVHEKSTQFLNSTRHAQLRAVSQAEWAAAARAYRLQQLLCHVGKGLFDVKELRVLLDQNAQGHQGREDLFSRQPEGGGLLQVQHSTTPC